MNLTEQQTKFLDLIFSGDPEYMGRGGYKKAANDAGYSEATSITIVVNSVKDEILSRTETLLAMNTPESVMRIVDVLRNPEMKGAKQVLEAAGMLLDRMGVTKKDRLEVEVKAANGLVFIPTKKD